MKRIGALIPMLTGIVVWSSDAQAQPADDTGITTMVATTSGYMDITAGGPATLSGSAGGSIANNKAKGQSLTGLSISMGEIGPVNRSPFVLVTLPLLVRGNTSYSLSVSASPIVGGGPQSVQLTDIGFGISRPKRSDAHVLPGSDAPAGAVIGNPATGPDAVPSTARWDYPVGKRLADYVTPTGVLSGSRILGPVPVTVPSGLTFEIYFCIKPQFFAPGTFSTTVVMTLSNP